MIEPESQDAVQARGDGEVVFRSQSRAEAVEAMGVLEAAGIAAEMTSGLGFGTHLATEQLAHTKVWTYEVSVSLLDSETAFRLIESRGLSSQMPDEHLQTHAKPWVVSLRLWVGRVVAVLVFVWLIVVMKMCLKLS